MKDHSRPAAANEPAARSPDAPDLPHGRAARVALDARLARAVASVRVCANGALAVVAAYGAFTESGAGLALARAALLAGAVAVLAPLQRGGRAVRRAVIAGLVLDAASLLVGGWHALLAPAGADLVRSGLALAEVVVAAAVLALAAAQVAVRVSLDVHLLRTVRARRARAAARRRRLERSRRELLDAQARAELLAQLVVHDLRNPLAVVLAHLRLVQAAVARTPGLASEVENLEIASGEALRLSRMVGDLLLVPRLERGELSGQFSAVQLREVLDAVARATEPQAVARGLRVAVDAPPALVAWIDADLVRRMVENLVANALRFTPGGGRIELAAYADGERLRLAVRNSGPPIPAAARARLFEKYSTHGPGRQNNGLGLFLCRLVSEVHGGRIALVEHKDWNVSFEADLPLAGRGAAPARARAATATEPSEPHANHSSRKNT